MVSRAHTISLAICTVAVYLVWGLILSLQPLLYPREAEAKGATPSQVKSNNLNKYSFLLNLNNKFQYGFVFGIVHLAAFVSAPIFAQCGLIIR